MAAREAVRVLRPGGVIGLVNWTPQGLIGRVLKAVGARLPKPPEYVSPAPLWGDEEHVRGLFAGTGVELEFERALNPFVGFDSAEDWVEFMETNYGPLLTAQAKLGGEWAEVRREIVALAESLGRSDADGFVVDSEYLLVIGRAAAA